MLIFALMFLKGDYKLIWSKFYKSYKLFYLCICTFLFKNLKKNMHKIVPQTL